MNLYMATGVFRSATQWISVAAIVSTASFAAPPAGVSAAAANQFLVLLAIILALAAALFVSLWLLGRRKPAPASTPLPGGSEIVESARDAIFVIEDSGAIVSCNQAAENLFGYPAAELRGKSISALIPPPDRGRRRANYIHASEGRVLNGIRKSGQTFPLDLMLTELPSSAGKRFSIILRDRSARTRAEQELESRQKFTDAVLDELPVLVVVASHDGRILRFNRACEDLTDFSEGELRGQTLWQALAAPDAMEAAQAEFQRLLDGEFPTHSTSTWCLRDHGLRTIAWNHNALRDEIGRLTHIVSVGAAAPAAVLDSGAHQGSLDAAARMAGGIAHEFNNLLTAIAGYSGLVLGAIDPAHPSRRDVEEIRKAGDRAAVLTRQLLAFSGKLPRKPEPVNINNILEDSLRILRPIAAEASIHIDLSLDSALPPVLADPRQLEECLLHLAAAAREAMPSGGTIQLESSVRNLSRPRPDARPQLAPGEYATFSLVHTGEGLPQSLLPHIFEPFVLSRELARSNGMSLAIAYGIVRQNGGSILVQSAPGCGATYRVFFPFAAAGLPGPVSAARDAQDADPTQSAPPVNDETILVATDSDSDRRRMRDALQQAGYLVLEARSALQAMEIAHKAPDAIHLAICDVQVPRMSGPELAATLRGIRSEIRSLYASAKSADEIRRQGMEPSSVFSIAEWDDARFLARVRQSLLAPAARGAGA
jgi:two-component system, cell cycle sensor histidine kinase and response regulator CckA